MTLMIPYGRQDIQQDDLDAVRDVLLSDFLTQGPAVPRFEQAVAACVGAQYAVAVNSATSALHVACAALDLGPGDLLWTSPITFVASANCARYLGAEVDFVDVDPVTTNMCPERLEEKLLAAQAAGRLPKIIVPVHLTGLSCDMARIGALAKRFGVKVVEDASHAIGARFEDAPVGACQYSDITVFSFHPVKIVTSGEGGVAVTQEETLAKRMARLRSHGITRDQGEMIGPSDGPWYYQQLELGWNYRMTDIHAALGAAQLTRVHDYVARRNALADRYDKQLTGLPLQRQGRLKGAYSAFHLYVVRVAAEVHRAVFESLRAQGIGVNLHYIPVHLQPYYRNLGFAKGDFPEAERYYSSAISIPLYPLMTDDQQNDVVAALASSFSQ